MCVFVYIVVLCLSTCSVQSDPVNRASLEDIETAQFSVSLDNTHPHMSDLDPNDDFTDYHRTIMANRALHGNGTKQNSCNRWSDTCIQVDKYDNRLPIHGFLSTFAY